MGLGEYLILPVLGFISVRYIILESTSFQLLPSSYIQIPSGVTFLKRNRSEKEVRAAALVLQTIWGYKELRKPLEKEGWKKSDFQVE